MSLNIGELVGYLRLDDNEWKRGVKSAQNDLRGMGNEVGNLLTKAGAIGPALGAGAAGLSALAAGGAAVVAAVGPAVGVVGALPAIYAAAAQAAGVAKFAFDGVVAASDSIAKAGNDPKKLAAAVDGLTPKAARLATTLAQTKAPIDDLRRSAQAGLFPGVSTSLDQLLDLLPLFRNEVRSTGDVLGGLATDATDKVVQRQGLLQKIMAGNLPIIQSLGSAGITLGDGLLHIVAAAQPLAAALADGADRAATFVTNAILAGSASGRLADFFDRAWRTASQLGRIVADIGVGIYNALSVGAPAGANLLDSVEGITQNFRDWTQSTSGIQSLSQWFADGQENLSALERLIKSVTTGISGFGARSNLAPLIDQISAEFVPALAELLQNASASGALSKLVSAITAVVKALAAASAEDSSLASFATTLKLFADAAAWVATNVPGAASVMGAFFVIMGAGQAAKILGLGGAFKLLGSTLVSLASTAVGAGATYIASLMGITVAEEASTASTLGLVAKRVAVVVAGWVAMGAAAIASAAETAAVWALYAAEAIAGAAAQSLAALRVVAAWVLMGVQSLLQAGRMAAAWLIAMGPIGLVIAAVVGLAFLIIKNWDTIKRVTVDVWNAIVGFVVGAAQNVLGWVKGHWPLLVGILTGPIGLAVVMIVKHWDKIKSSAVSAFNGVVTFMQSIPGRILTALGDLGQLLLHAGGQIIQGLIDGIVANAHLVTDEIGKVAKSIRDHFPFSPAKTGPLKDHPLDQAGRNLIHQLAKGISDGQPEVKTVVGKVADLIKKYLSGSAETRALKGLHDDAKGLTVAGRALDKATDRVVAAKKKLADAIKNRNDFSTSMADSLRDAANLTNAIAGVTDDNPLSVGSLQDFLGKQLASLTQYDKDLDNLTSRGISPDFLKQFAGAGFGDATTLAHLLAMSNDQSIGILNVLQGQISGLSSSIGAKTGNTLFGAGIDDLQLAADKQLEQQKRAADKLDTLAADIGKEVKNAFKDAKVLVPGGW